VTASTVAAPGAEQATTTVAGSGSSSDAGGAGAYPASGGAASGPAALPTGPSSAVASPTSGGAASGPASAGGPTTQPPATTDGTVAVTAAPPTGGAASPSPAAPEPAWAAGFGRATVTMEGRPLQVVVASTPEQRNRGLREVTTLAPFDGMLFVFDKDGQVRFTMANTLMPLTIGFYDSTGQVVGQLDMYPCEGTDSSCPTYDLGAPFRYALEAELGHLPTGPIQI
jgi:uncharacterized membrane protein (UPF0127 family)